MNKFSEGDIVYTFLGENLCEMKVLYYEDDIRIAGECPDANVCVYEYFCYRTTQQAIDGMLAAIVLIQ